MLATRRSELKVGNGTALIFTEIYNEKTKQPTAVTLSIVGPDFAQTKRLGPKFGHELHRIVKRLMEAA